MGCCSYFTDLVHTSASHCSALAVGGANFEDMGLENISNDLKLSAIESLDKLSSLGILHGDLALRNIVVSRENSSRAKFIAFERDLLRPTTRP